MKLAQNKMIVVMLMLVAFIGQAMASTAMPCAHESMNVDMPMMNHANMMSINVGQDDSQGSMMDCCQEQCKCPMSGCLSLSVLLDTRFNSGVIAEQKISQLPLIHQSQINTSLYRPPIS